MTELALVEQSSTIDVGKWAETLIFAVQLAEKVHDTEFVPQALRGRPEAVAATIMYGAEVGVTPMQALAGIHIVEGKPAPSAELMRAMILRAGHTITVHEASGTRVRVSGLRRGAPESERYPVEWTLDMARAAGLTNRVNWRNYPRAMLLARATSDLARTLFPDVIKGLGYVAEDSALGTDAVWGPPEVVQDEPPARPPLQRKRAAKKLAAPKPEQWRTDDFQGEHEREQAPVAPGRPVEDVPLPAVEEDTGLGASGTPTPEAPPIRSQEDVDSELAEALAEKPSQPPARFAHQDEPLTPVTMPALEPEQPSPEEPPPPGVGPALIAAAPMKALNTLLTRELGTAATAVERHALLEAILMRPIHSIKELTRAEGIEALSWMDRFAAGEAAWEFDLRQSTPEEPVVTITVTEDPPEEVG